MRYILSDSGEYSLVVMSVSLWLQLLCGNGLLVLVSSVVLAYFVSIGVFPCTTTRVYVSSVGCFQVARLSVVPTQMGFKGGGRTGGRASCEVWYVGMFWYRVCSLFLYMFVSGEVLCVVVLLVFVVCWCGL